MDWSHSPSTDPTHCGRHRWLGTHPQGPSAYAILERLLATEALRPELPLLDGPSRMLIQSLLVITVLQFLRRSLRTLSPAPLTHTHTPLNMKDMEFAFFQNSKPGEPAPRILYHYSAPQTSYAASKPVPVNLCLDSLTGPCKYSTLKMSLSSVKDAGYIVSFP